MKRIFLLAGIIAIFAVSCSNTDDPVKDNGNEGNGGNGSNGENTVEAVMNTLWNETSCREFSVKRLKALEKMQGYADQCQNTVFKSYIISEDKLEVSNYEKGYGILDFYDKAFGRVLDDMKSASVAEGTVAIWQIYNMGYIVKTPEGRTFGIDICHRRSPELVSYLDFALITHNHSDHYTKSFIDEMTKAGKPLYSNYLENEYKISGTETFKPLSGSDISIIANIVDHGMANPADFVVSYEIDCGAKSGNTVVFHIGDCGNVTQLNPTKAVDVFIPHLAVNLDMSRAIKEKVKPAMVLMSHVLQMEYPISGSYRWSYTNGYNACVKQDAETKFVFLPVWGERVDYRRM